MGRRERLEKRLEDREEWAEKRKARSDQSFDQAREATDGIPMGQPILVGHHSEGHHRAALKKSDNAMRAGVEHADMAKRHAEKASGLERILDGTIFSDDPDAVEALEAKLEGLEATRQRLKSVGAAWRKAKKPEPTDKVGWELVRELAGLTENQVVKFRLDAARDCLNRGPVPSYLLSNLSGRIRQAKQRIEQIQRLATRQSEAEALDGVKITRTELGFASICFSEKPDREILKALRAARFHWGGGVWNGYADEIPECVQDMERS